MENRFKEAFPGLRHVFLIAIHVTPTWADADRDIKVAYDEGADGVIVIRDYNTPANNHDVLGTYRVARKQYPLWWIGINLLGVHPGLAIQMIDHGTSGVWFDSVGIDETRPSSVEHLAQVKSASDIYHLPKPPLIMPSVAFKYQHPITRDYAKVVELAQPHADILITSGVATGEPADLDKVLIMRSACKIPFGLASGVAVDNVEDYLELDVDCFIVNTSISNPKTGRLDPAKVRELRTKIPRH